MQWYSPIQSPIVTILQEEIKPPQSVDKAIIAASTSILGPLILVPTTNHQPPTTSHQTPATSHQPPATSHQPPTTNHQPPTTNHQPPTLPRYRYSLLISSTCYISSFSCWWKCYHSDCPATYIRVALCCDACLKGTLTLMLSVVCYYLSSRFPLPATRQKDNSMSCYEPLVEKRSPPTAPPRPPPRESPATRSQVQQWWWH